jgi:hypothetical protein
VKSHTEAGKPVSTRHEGNANVKTLSMSTNVTGTRTSAQSLPSTSTRSTEMFCAMCDRSNHDLDVCRKYLGKSLPERKEFLMGKKLCFSCYKPTSAQHCARNCQQRRICKTCGKQHPTSLHGLRKALTSCTTTAANGPVTVHVFLFVYLSCVFIYFIYFYMFLNPAFWLLYSNKESESESNHEHHHSMHGCAMQYYGRLRFPMGTCDF